MRRSAVVVAGIVASLGVVGYSQLPAIGAGALLHPSRRMTSAPPPQGCLATTIKGANVDLAGWRCAAEGRRRGTIVYLHGVADNRASGVGVIERFTRRGFDVIAYDSRAHGGSGGDACTYGYFEKEDLGYVIDAIANSPVILIGTSLGAAVALQHAPRDPRVVAVVAAETFADLRSIAIARAPFVFSGNAIERALVLAEEQAGFDLDGVSPERAAATIVAPVLLIHGEADDETPIEHAERVYNALRGSKRLMRVAGAGHNASLNGEVWRVIESWIDGVIGQ